MEGVFTPVRHQHFVELGQTQLQFHRLLVIIEAMQGCAPLLLCCSALLLVARYR